MSSRRSYRAPYGVWPNDDGNMVIAQLLRRNHGDVDAAFRYAPRQLLEDEPDFKAKAYRFIRAAKRYRENDNFDLYKAGHRGDWLDRWYRNIPKHIRYLMNNLFIKLD